jgi:hypothetical protein
MTNAELLGLLREAREFILRFGKIEEDHNLRDRIDAALAEHEAEERVTWSPLADGKTCAAEVNGCLVEVRPSYAGDSWWAWKAEQPVKHRDRQHGHKRTMEQAQEAAVLAARGIK